MALLLFRLTPCNIRYLVSSDIDLNNKKEINKKLKDFPNKYYTEVKYELFIDDTDTINIKYKEVN